MDPEFKAEEQEKLLSKVKKIITDAEGKVSEVKEWGKKELAYLIAKKGFGIFVEIQFNAPAKLAPSLRQKLQLESNLLRFLLIADKRR